MRSEAAEMNTRSTGMVLLALCAVFFYVLHGFVAAGPRHSPTMVEMALVGVLSGCSGAMALLIGREWFEPFPRTPKREEVYLTALEYVLIAEIAKHPGPARSRLAVLRGIGGLSQEGGGGISTPPGPAVPRNMEREPIPRPDP